MKKAEDQADQTGLLWTFVFGGFSVGAVFFGTLHSLVWGIAIGAACTTVSFVLYAAFPTAANTIFLRLRGLVRHDDPQSVRTDQIRGQRRAPSSHRIVILIIVSALVGASATAAGLFIASDTGGPARVAQPPVAAPGVTVSSAEGLTAALSIANVTRGDTVYSSQSKAAVDDVLKVAVTYRNNSHETEIDDVSANFNLPTNVASNLPISADVYGSGSVLRPSVDVNVDSPDARLSFIPNSVQWKYNKPGTVTIVQQTLPDAVLLGAPTPLENLQPGDAGSIAILVRVVAAVVAVTVECAAPGSSRFSASIDATPGDSIQCTMKITNAGNQVLDSLEAYDNIPPHTRFNKDSLSVVVAGAKVPNPPGLFVDPRSPTGVGRTNAYSPVLQLGNLQVAAVATIGFALQILRSASGGSQLENVSVATAAGIGEVYNVAIVDLAKT